MKIINFFKVNQRQNRALIYQMTALLISCAYSYVSDFTFGVFLLTELLIGGAIVYSNEDFLKYKLSRCILITVIFVTIFSIFHFIIPWVLIVFIRKEGAEILQLVLIYVLFIAILKTTQKQVKLGLFQMFSGAILLLFCLAFIYNATFGYSLKGHYILFFINQYFVSIFVVSTLASTKEVVPESTLVRTELLSTPLQLKNIYKFLKFIILALVGVGLLFLLYLMFAIYIWGGFES